MKYNKISRRVIISLCLLIGASCSDRKADIQDESSPPNVSRNEYNEIQTMKFVDSLGIDTLNWYAVGSRKFSTKSPDHSALMAEFCRKILPRTDSNISSLKIARDQTNENHYYLENTINVCSEIGENQKLFRQLGAKFEKAEKLISKRREEDKKARKEQEEEGRSAERKLFGQTMRDAYLDDGMDIKVRVYGKNNTNIELNYILFNDVWSHKMKSGDIIQELSNMGFKKLEMTDGYDWAVYWDLN